MPVETVYADLVLAVAALIAGVLYLRARRRHVRRKKAGPPVRPATPLPNSAGGQAVTTWAPPPAATHVAPTVVAPPSPSWDQPQLRLRLRLPIRPGPGRPGVRPHRQRRTRPLLPPRPPGEPRRPRPR